MNPFFIIPPEKLILAYLNDQAPPMGRRPIQPVFFVAAEDGGEGAFRLSSAPDRERGD
jgi:hypothetical protein